jgi:hypothetical protein
MELDRDPEPLAGRKKAAPAAFIVGGYGPVGRSSIEDSSRSRPLLGDAAGSGTCRHASGSDVADRRP